MPDLDPLPPLPRRPSLPPRPGDFDEMTRRVRRRRTGRLAGAGSAVGVAAAVAFVLAGGPGGIDRLVADPASTGDDPTPAASTSATPTPSAGVTPSPVGQPGASPTSPGTSTTEPGPTATAAPSPSASGTAPGTQPPPHATLVRDDVPYATGTCNPGGGEGPGWCIRTPPNTTAQTDVARDYVLQACRLPGSGSGEMAFNTRDEIYFHVLDERGAHYTWGRPDWSKVSHRVAIAAGRCAKWTFTWDTTDDRGVPLQPGDYSVSVSFYATFSGVQAGSTTYGFTLRVVD